MKNIKFISIFLVFAILISLAGCKKASNEVNSAESTSSNEEKSNLSSFKLLYCSKDSFDPYRCKTKQNLDLSYLLFDPLIKTDNNFDYKYCLAESAAINGNLCSVVLKNAKFSDGTLVTADDVVFSFEKAKKSSTVYAYSLKNAISATATGTKSVSFKLSKNDPYFYNVLDFPIIKKGSDHLTNSDNKELPPTGSGRYVFTEDLKSLIKNTNYHGGGGSFETISLIDSPDNESSLNNIEIGAVDYYFSDLADGTFPKMNGKKAQINMTNLVFLGVNQNNIYLSKVLVRQAVSAAINRTVIAENQYFTNATEAVGPFPSCFAPAIDYQTIKPTDSAETVKNNLTSAGFTDRDSEGYYISSNKRVSLRILVNKDNEVRLSAAKKIAEQLNTSGIYATVKAVSRAEYDSAISAKNYDLYLGEMKYSANMDLTELCDFVYTHGFYGNSTQNTASTSSEPEQNGSSITTKSAVSKFYSGEITIGDLITVFTSELPVIPVVFRTGLAVYTNNIKNNLTPSYSDLFYGFEKIY